MATRIREKAKVRKETADKRPRATARYVRISSRKVKIVIADLFLKLKCLRLYNGLAKF